MSTLQLIANKKKIIHVCAYFICFLMLTINAHMTKKLLGYYIPVVFQFYCFQFCSWNLRSPHYNYQQYLTMCFFSLMSKDSTSLWTDGNSVTATISATRETAPPTLEVCHPWLVLDFDRASWWKAKVKTKRGGKKKANKMVSNNTDCLPHGIAFYLCTE